MCDHIGTTDRSLVHPYTRRHNELGYTLTPLSCGAHRTWMNKLQKYLFLPHEIVEMYFPRRRKVMVTSLEAHIDLLLARLRESHLLPFELVLMERGPRVMSRPNKVLYSLS